MTNTKAYGWAASTIHHVVLLGVGGQARGGGGVNRRGWWGMGRSFGVRRQEKEGC